MANDINKIFVNVQNAEAAGKYVSTYVGEDRDKSRDSQVAFLTSYGTIATKGNILTGGLKGDVLVAGGPLADDVEEGNWPEEWYKDGNKCIPANTDLQTLITKLFLKEKYNIVSIAKSNTANWDPATFVLKREKDGSILNNGAIVEYGENVQMTSVNAGTITAGTFTRSITQTNGNYGMFVDGVHKTAYSETVNATQSGIITLSYYANTTEIIPDTNIQITTNTTFNVYESGITSTSDTFTETTAYNSSNTKKQGTQYVTWNADTDDKVLTKDAIKTINASRYMFVGTETTYRTTDPTAAEIRQLSVANEPAVKGTFKRNLPACKTMIYALPIGHTLIKCYATSTAGAVDFVSKMKLKTIAIPGANGTTAINYNVYYYSSETNFGDEEFTFVIA